MCSCILYGYSHLPQAKIWASLGGPQLPIRSRRKIPLPEGTHLDLRLSHGKIGIILRCNPWAVGWCMFDRFSISDFGGKWPLKWKFSKMSFRIHRRNTEIRFVAKFGENWPLRCRKVVWITTQKNKKYVLSNTNSESVKCNFFIFDHVTFIQFKICCCVQRIFTVDSLKDADLRKDVPFGGLDD